MRQRLESLFKIFSGPPPARYARTRSAATGWVIVQAWALYAAFPSTESLKEPLHEKLSLDPGRHFRSCRNPGGLRCAQPRCWRVKHPSRPAPRGRPMQCRASAVVCGQRQHRQRDRGGAGAVGCPHGAGVAPRPDDHEGIQRAAPEPGGGRQRPHPAASRPCAAADAQPCRGRA